MNTEEIEAIRKRNEERRRAWGTLDADTADSNYNALFVGHKAVADIDALLAEIKRLKDREYPELEMLPW